ncbi:MAG: hypothetical protein JWO41_496 [Candidatus Saccharibacteria bacterium]|nr:hypothetical protein [Candidatus Saccharibacteria bacterium]
MFSCDFCYDFSGSFKNKYVRKSSDVKRPWKIAKVLVVAALVAGVFGIGVRPLVATAVAPTTVPNTISFQGKIVNFSNGTNVADGTYSVTFRLYSALSGGTAVWGETQASVTVAGGVFQVNLGSTCSFFVTQTCSGISNTAIDFSTGPSLYLTVQFAADSQETSPRIPLQSVPFAFNAETANKLGGLTANQFIQQGGNTFSGTTAADIGTINNGSLNFRTNNGIRLTVSTTGDLQFALGGARTINIAQETGTTVGDQLTIAAGQGGSTGAVGGILALQGGNASGAGNTNGGNVTVDGGVATGSGARGTIVLQGTSGVVNIGAVTTPIAGFSLEAATSRNGPAGIAAHNSNTGTQAFTAFYAYSDNAGGTNNYGLIGAAASTYSIFPLLSNRAFLLAGSSTSGLVVGSVTGTNPTLFVNGNAEAGRFTAAGNLSLGNTNDTYKLDVTGDINASANIRTAGTQRIDSSGNIVNAGNWTSTAGSTFLTTGSNGFIFKPGTNSSTAFQVQRSNGEPLVSVDTTTSNLITNPGFEVNTTGWAARNSSTVTQNTNTANTYNGIASLQIATATGTANQGASTSSFTSTVAAGTYTLSFFAKYSGTLPSTFRAGYNQGASDVVCGLSASGIVTSGFVRFSCTFTTTANLVSLFIDDGATAVTSTLYIDAVQLQTGSSATPYTIGSIQLRSVISNPLSLQATGDSTSAFQIQNTAGTSNLFVADTLNGRIGINKSAPTVALDVAGTINATGYSINGTAGKTLTCAGGQTTAITAVSSGIVTVSNACTGISDSRVKENITELDDSVLGQLQQVGAVHFNFKCEDPDLTAQFGFDCSLQTGVIAQQVATIFPDLVTLQEDGYYHVNYQNLGIYTLKGVQELAQHLSANGDANLNVVTANNLTVNGDLTVNGTLHYSAIDASNGNFSNGIISPSLVSDGALTIDSGTSGDVTIDTGGNSAAVNIGTTSASAVRVGHTGGTTSTEGNVDFSFADNEGFTLSNKATNSAAQDAALHIDNANASQRVTTAVKITNSGGAGYDTIISSPNFTVTGDGNVTAGTISSTGSFALFDATHNLVASIDQSGNASFDGNLTAANLTANGGLSVGGDANFAGLSAFQKLATFFGKVIFRQDVRFDAHITVASDTAGYAQLKTGETTVHVTFVTPYETTPIVTSNITNGQFALSSINNVTATGFDVVLSAPALSDTMFSWTALGVTSPQTAANLPANP